MKDYKIFKFDMKDYKTFKKDCLYKLESITYTSLSKVIGEILTDRIRSQLTLYYKSLIYFIYLNEISRKDYGLQVRKFKYQLIGYTKALVDCCYARESLYKMAKDSVKIIQRELEENVQ